MYETTKEEIIKAQNGDQKTMEQIIEKNNGLIWSIVKRFVGRGYETEDLYQIGCMGFIKAIQRFDTQYEVKISTYAVPYILGEIKRFLRDDGPIKVSRSVKELAIKIKEIQREHLNKNGEEIGVIELAKILKLPKEEIAVAIDAIRPLESINENAYTGEQDGMSKIELISNKIDEAEMVVNRVTMKQLIQGLSEKEKAIIYLRYYSEKTQSDVAKLLGITQVQVSRMEKKILSAMKIKMCG